MQYLISFLEGIITFISPCLLPMLPIYIAWFSGGESSQDSKKTFWSALGFVTGFSVLFILLGAFASSVGMFFQRNQNIVNIITGLIVIVFGLNFMGIWNLPVLNRTKKLNHSVKPGGFFSSILFGIIFSIGWTPCVGAFLGSALMLAARQDTIMQGVLLLLSYSLGLGIPFLISAVLIDHLKKTFDFIKKHYRIINAVSGLFLIITGIMMMTGYMNTLLAALTF